MRRLRAERRAGGGTWQCKFRRPRSARPKHPAQGIDELIRDTRREPFTGLRKPEKDALLIAKLRFHH